MPLAVTVGPAELPDSSETAEPPVAADSPVESVVLVARAVCCSALVVPAATAVSSAARPVELVAAPVCCSVPAALAVPVGWAVVTGSTVGSVVPVETVAGWVGLAALVVSEARPLLALAAVGMVELVVLGVGCLAMVGPAGLPV